MLFRSINAIDDALKNYGYKTIRIGNIFNLVKFLSVGKKVDLVFNICEGLYGPSRESQVPCLLEAYETEYVFSSSLVLATTLNKSIAKTILYGIIGLIIIVVAIAAVLSF